MANKKFSDEELLKILKEYTDIYGVPKSKDFTRKNGFPHNELYRKRFGSWFNALQLAGVKIPKDKLKYYQNDRISDEKLLNDLKKKSPYLKSKNGAIVLDPKNKQHREWYEND